MTRLDEFHRLRAIETDDCVEWPYAKARGYGYVLSEGRRWRTHRLALVLATDENPFDLDAAHGPCHNRACMNVRHLSWKTRSQNALDMNRDGTMPRAKLIEAQVIEILSSTEPRQVLADRYGVAISTISSICTRKRWVHLKDPTNNKEK